MEGDDLAVEAGVGVATNEFSDAVADDAMVLATLHDRELSPALIAILRAERFPSGLGLLPQDPSAHIAWRAMNDAVGEIAKMSNLDGLHADFASIYLTGAIGASPCESVWTDDDGLMCQAAMFELRTVYAAAGLGAANWRKRPEDHLVMQLLYLAVVARRSSTPQDWGKIGRFLDDHLLRWLPNFAARVVGAGSSAFYAALAVLSVEWIQILRRHLESLSGETRADVRANVVQGVDASSPCTIEPMAYLPGGAPSW